VLLLINVNDTEEEVELSLDHECRLTKEIIYQSDDVHVQNTFDKPFEIVPLEKDIKNDAISMKKALKLRKNSIGLFIIK
jgi:alpha-L-arabinofuranosidase